MILTVTPNLALDITYEVARLIPGATHRVRQVRQRAGGKGVNVARVLRALGVTPVIAGLAGGPTGTAIRAELAEAGFADALTPIAGESRRTVTIVSEMDSEPTMCTEPGPAVSGTEWANLRARFTETAARTEVVVLSGSLPPGVPEDGYAQLIRIARDLGARTILDASGPALLAGLTAGPDIVKPNAAELRAATGIDDDIAAAQTLARTGTAVVASLGPGGLLAVTDQGSWRARPPRALSGNPTGAGDACVAALALGLANRVSWSNTLVKAVAASAAAVVCPVAGEIDQDTYAHLLADVVLEELDAAHPHR
ncbi:MAG TPA: 1-phosphofructokinase family hexose kinase [Pseudonocardiaceae bacterium]